MSNEDQHTASQPVPVDEHHHVAGFNLSVRAKSDDARALGERGVVLVVESFDGQRIQRHTYSLSQVQALNLSLVLSSGVSRELESWGGPPSDDEMQRIRQARKAEMLNRFPRHQGEGEAE